MKISAKKSGYFIKSLLILVFGLIFMLPVFLIFMNSIKPNSEIMLSFLSLPRTVFLDNFGKAIEQMHFFRAFRNMLIMTIGTVVLSLAVSFTAAYGIAHLSQKLSRGFYYFFILGQLIPFHAVMIYISVMSTRLHMNNTLWGIVLINGGLNCGFGIMTYVGFLKSIPAELEEAAAMDGCNIIQSMLHVVFPLMRTTSVTLGVLYFLWSWNEYLLPSILIGKSELRPLTVNLYAFKGATNTEWDLLIAGLTLTILPIILIYILAQKYISNGLMAGAVKS